MDDNVGKYIVFKFEPTKTDGPGSTRYKGISGPINKLTDNLGQNRAKAFKNQIANAGRISLTPEENASYIESGTFASDHRGEQLSVSPSLYTMGADPYQVLGEVEKFGQKVSPDFREGVMTSMYNTADGLENYVFGDENLSYSLRSINQNPNVTLSYVEAEEYTPGSNEVAFSYSPDTGLSQVYDLAKSVTAKPLAKLKGKAKKKALKLAKKGAKKLGKTAVGKAGKKAVKRLAKVGGKKAAKFLTKQGIQHLGGLIGSAIPGAGTAAGELIGRIVAELLFIVAKIIKKFAKYIAAAGLAVLGAGVLMASPFMIVGGGMMIAGGAVAGGTVAISAGIASLTAMFPFLFTTVLAGMVPTIIISLIATPLIIAFIVFVITTGAYVVPGPGEILEGGTAGQLPGPVNPGKLASGTCPLTGDYFISAPSYNYSTESGHGSNAYWGTRSCNYDIPLESMGGCWGPNYTGSEQNNCFNHIKGSCKYYGYAVDVMPRPADTRDREVIAPHICDPSGECGPLTWTVTSGWFNCEGGGTDTPEECGLQKWGYGIVMTAAGNGHFWKIHISHIDPEITLLTGGKINRGRMYTSGDVLGEATEYLIDLPNSNTTHIHVELMMDGIPISPDFLCSGEGGIEPPGTQDNVGWLISQSVIGNVTSTRPPNYGLNSCAWSANREPGSPKYAVNANYANDITDAVGHAGFDDGYEGSGFTLRGINKSTLSLATLVIKKDKQTAYISDYDLIRDIDTSDVRLLVTGVKFGQAGLDTNIRPRIALGLGDGPDDDSDADNVYIIVLKADTIVNTYSKLTQEIEAKGDKVVGTILLDGGRSTTLCADSNLIFTGNPSGEPSAIPNSIGIGNFGSELIQLVDTGGTIPSCSNPKESDTARSDIKVFSSPEKSHDLGKFTNDLIDGISKQFTSETERSTIPVHAYVLESCQSGKYKELYEDMISKNIVAMTLEDNPSAASNFPICFPNCLFILGSRIGKDIPNPVSNIIWHESKHMIQGNNNPDFAQMYWNGSNATTYAAFIEAYTDEGPEIDGLIQDGTYYPCRISYLRSLAGISNSLIDRAGKGFVSDYNTLVSRYNSLSGTVGTFEELFPVRFADTSLTNTPPTCH